MGLAVLVVVEADDRGPGGGDGCLKRAERCLRRPKVTAGQGEVVVAEGVGRHWPALAKRSASTGPRKSSTRSPLAVRRSKPVDAAGGAIRAVHVEHEVVADVGDLPARVSASASARPGPGRSRRSRPLPSPLAPTNPAPAAVDPPEGCLACPGVIARDTPSVLVATAVSGTIPMLSRLRR